VAEQLLLTAAVAKVLHILPGGQLQEHVATGAAEAPPAPAKVEESQPQGR